MSITEGYAKLSAYSSVSRSIISKYFAIGNFSFMQRCRTSRYVTIGSRVSIGAFSHPTDWLSTLEFQFRDSSGFYGDSLDASEQYNIDEYVHHTEIGSDVWIGDNVYVKSGVSIGHGVVIGAGAIVTKDVEAYSIVAGNPAKTIRKRFNDRTIGRLLELNWWNLDIGQLKGVKFNKIDQAIEDIERIKAAIETSQIGIGVE